jgi:superfamily II DNA or RNA helicase
MRMILENKIHIPGGLSDALRLKLRNRLTTKNPLYEDARAFGRMVRGIPKTIKLYEEKGSDFIIPRGVFDEVETLLKENGLGVEIENHLPEKILITPASKIKLWDYQERLVDIAMRKRGGIIVAAPGSGKTVTGLELICRYGLRALWITHTSVLADQAINRIKAFIDNVSIGFIGAGKWSIGDITVALVQTLYKRDLSIIAKEFPLVVVDECHHTPSTTFTDVVGQFWCHHLIGLSATPYRKDGLENIMFDVLGPVIASVEKEELIAKGKIIPAMVIQKNTGVSLSNHILEYQDIISALYAIDKRIDIIAGDVVAEATLGNTCVVLTNTIDYGRKLTERINSFGVPADLVFSTEVTIEKKKIKRLTMPKKERSKLIDGFLGGNKHVLVVTFKLLSEGFDHQPLNRLFMASPISPKNRTLIEQTCGRVERFCEGKEDAVVFDYVDDHSLLLYQAQKRALIYTDNQMKVEVDNSLV